jgi:hypothetical protein
LESDRSWVLKDGKGPEHLGLFNSHKEFFFFFQSLMERYSLQSFHWLLHGNLNKGKCLFNRNIHSTEANTHTQKQKTIHTVSKTVVLFVSSNKKMKIRLQMKSGAVAQGCCQRPRLLPLCDPPSFSLWLLYLGCNVIISLLFYGTGAWTQGFTLAGEALYHLSHSASPWLIYFQIF